jgi:hypothetical protein
MFNAQIKAMKDLVLSTQNDIATKKEEIKLLTDKIKTLNTTISTIEKVSKDLVLEDLATKVNDNDSNTNIVITDTTPSTNVNTTTVSTNDTTPVASTVLSDSFDDIFNV